MPKLFRICWKLASYLLLLGAAGHSVGHYLAYEDESRFSLARRALVAAMKSSASGGPTHPSTWTMLQMFSLAFGLFLAFAGLANLVLLRAGPPLQILKRMTVFNLIFWGMAFLLFLLVHPVLQPIVISGAVALLFGLALWSVRGEVRSM